MDLHEVQNSLWTWKHECRVVPMKRRRHVPVHIASEAKGAVAGSRHDQLGASAECGGGGVVVPTGRADPELKRVEPSVR